LKLRNGAGVGCAIHPYLQLPNFVDLFDQKKLFHTFSRCLAPSSSGRLGTDSGAAHPESGAAHLALHRSPLIIGIGARAALPEAARGGVHGGWLCGLCALVTV